MTSTSSIQTPLMGNASVSESEFSFAQVQTLLKKNAHGVVKKFLDPVDDVDHPQNLFNCSLSYYEAVLDILAKSVHSFSSC